MIIQITARHDSVTDGMKHYAEQKGEKLVRIFDGLTKIEIVLDGQGARQSAEAILAVAGGETIVVRAEESKMNAAIDAMIDRAERRVRDHKEKRRDHRAESPEVSDTASDAGEDLETYSEVIDRTEFPSP